MSGWPHPPEACLVNFYSDDAKMGLHQDRDEQELAAPVVSVSLGDDCLFRVGGTRRDDRTLSFKLRSGDVVVLGGEGRLAFHGVDRIYPMTSTLLKNGGRINLTLRRVTRPPASASSSQNGKIEPYGSCPQIAREPEDECGDDDCDCCRYDDIFECVVATSFVHRLSVCRAGCHLPSGSKRAPAQTVPRNHW